MKLNQLRDNPGARKSATRVGRGIGSGKGKTCGRGQKGQKSRSGVAIKGFEGGQMPLYRRMPKSGFNNPNAKEYAVVTLDTIQHYISTGVLSGDITAETLKSARIISRVGDGLRVIKGKKPYEAKAKIVATKASAGAIEVVSKAGGTLEVLPAKVNKLLKEGKVGKKAQRVQKGIEKAEARDAKLATKSKDKK